MTIYGRFGDKVKIIRTAVLADVQKLDGRNPDKWDKDAVNAGCYVVVKAADHQEDQKERLYAQAFLRADGGSVEIGKAIEEADAAMVKK